MIKKIIFVSILFLAGACAKREIVIKETPIVPREQRPLEVVIESKKSEEPPPGNELKEEPVKNSDLFLPDDLKITERQASSLPPAGSESNQSNFPKPSPVEERNIGKNDFFGANVIKPKTEDKKILEDIHFDYDQTSLKSEVKEQLKKHVRWMKDNPQVKVVIEGHCDERGTAEYNLSLGEKRAIAVKNYLVSLGMDLERFSTISYGEEKPLSKNHNEESWAINRRAHFQVFY